MRLRRSTALALALAALACEPSVSPPDNPTSVDYAAFDPTGSPPDIPLPNDLALLPQAIATQCPAQAALLSQWAVEGFPNDQEVPITIDFVSEKIDPTTGIATRSAPVIDTTSINPTNLLLLSLSASASGAVSYDAPQPTDYTVNGDHGTLIIHKSADPKNGGSRRWPANTEIVIAVRGGASGVKVTGGALDANGKPVGLQPQAAMYLLLQDKDLLLPENQSILPGKTRAEKAAYGTQLETLRKGYLVPFAAIDASGAFSHHEIATLGTFRVADTSKRTHVETDPSAGRMPLPSDFLTGADGHLLPSLCVPTGPFGPLGPGLCTLDGFSTTAMVLSQTSTAIQANTVAGGVFIYEVNPAATPPFRRLLEIAEALGAGKPPEYAGEPSPITQAAISGGTCSAHPTEPCLSTAIGLQPAVPAPIPVAPFLLTLPPLKEGITYVVLVTDKVKDLNGDPLVRCTLGKILFLDPSISVAPGGKSCVAGVTDAQGVGIDLMRQAINGAAQVLAAEKSITRDHLVMGYTFKTQTMKTAAVKLAALPYGTPTSTVSPLATPKFFGALCFISGAPAACPDGVVTDVFSAYGVDTTVVPHSNIGTIVEAKIVTFNALDPATGAFIDLTNPANQPVAEPITALVALPALTNTNIAGCNPAAPPCKVPLVIFRHGIFAGRGEMLPLADTLNAQGIAVASIDANKQGDRAFCSKDSECTGTGAKCTAIAALANQGDAPGPTPGKCTVTSGNADFVRRPVLCPTGGCTTANLTEGIPIASGNFILSANFFRTRDSFRQDLIDQSQLVRVLSPDPTDPTCAVNASHPNGCANAVFTATTGLEIDPTKIWYVGVSLGSINGTVDVAANPRISKAALSVGGGTFIDLGTNSPAFAGTVNTLLAGIGITPGTAAFLQFVNVAKWAMDPAEPLNFADNLSHNTLASPLSGGAAPPARSVLSVVSNCDLVVPNPFELQLHGLATTASGGPSALELLTHVGSAGGDYSSIGQTSCAVTVGAATVPVPEAVTGAGAVPHGILFDWGSSNGGTTDANLNALTGAIQGDVRDFLFSGTIPPASRNAP